MQIQKATQQDRDAIIRLLQFQNLPSEDLPLKFDDFYIVKDHTEVIAAIGMEQFNEYALLRSMVVHPAYRNRQIAESLVQQLERAAIAQGIAAMYLLTETAAKYFEKKGYNYVDRSDVPGVLKQSSEFSHVCPVSATVMMKELHAEQVLSMKAAILTSQPIN